MDAALFQVIRNAIHSVSKRTLTMVMHPESSLVDDLALDSLDLVGVLMNMEDHFDIKIELDDVPNIVTIADLASHLKSVHQVKTHAA